VKFSFITYCELPTLDPDDQLIARALEARGHNTQPLVWNDRGVDWKQAGTCVVRSTWDYHKHVQEFSRWINEVAKQTVLLNAPSLMLWNMNKRYLLGLENLGIRIVPTILCSSESIPNIESLCVRKGWNTLIIKPAIGLATHGVKKFGTTQVDLELAMEHTTSLLKDGDVLIQPYLPSVETSGEKSLVFIGGEFSHAVRKMPFQALAVAGQAGETLAVATPDEIEFGSKVLNVLHEKTLYARVDIVCDESFGDRVESGVERSGGEPVLLELELIEPSLFLSMKPSAAEMFADKLLSS
jgi:Prokaryotic glutathione synthetase, ATP-grasp domain